MNRHIMKLFLEKSSFNVGCVGTKYTPEELASLPQGKNMDRIGDLLTRIRNKYGDELEVSVRDPRSIVSVIDNVRYNVKSSKPVWVLDGKKIFEDVPSWEDLQKEIDRAIKH